MTREEKTTPSVTRRGCLTALAGSTALAIGGTQRSRAGTDGFNRKNNEKTTGSTDSTDNNTTDSTDNSTADSTNNNTTTSSGAAFDPEQTFTDISWLTNADANDTLNVETVTNLDSTGTGSLREAANVAAPTVVVFEVGGVINVAGSHIDASAETWIAGETAPSPGISIIEGGLEITSNRVIASHLGMYAGDKHGEIEAIAIRGDDQVYDHCSAFWGVDETIGMSDAQRRVSVINSVFAEGLDDSVHSEGRHSRGYLINDPRSQELCTMGCLAASNNRRNPWSTADHVYVNHMCFNHGSSPGEGSATNLPGPYASEDNTAEFTAKGILMKPSSGSDTSAPVFENDTNLYYEDVETDAHPLTESGVNVVNDPPLLPSGLDLANDPVPASELEDWIRTNSGMRPADRPGAERDFFQNRFNDTFSGTVDKPEDVGGYPSYTSTSRSLSVPGTNVIDWIERNHTAVVEGW